MPSVRYTFSCNTEQDLDLIQWLDSFPSRERTVVIKDALRAFSKRTPDKLDYITNNLIRVLREIKSIKQNGVVTHKKEQRTVDELDMNEIRQNISNIME